MMTWDQRKRARQREALLRENIRYRQKLREVSRNEKCMRKSAEQYAAQALEAERAGDHARAVRMAAEAAKLKKHLAMTGSMRGSLEIAHAVQSANQAMADIMRVSSSAAGSLLEGAADPDVYTLQTELLTMQEHVRSFMEESEMLCDDLDHVDHTPVSEEGERYLKTLMSSSSKDKQLKRLQDINTRLEQLQRSRPGE